MSRGDLYAIDNSVPSNTEPVRTLSATSCISVHVADGDPKSLELTPH